MATTKAQRAASARYDRENTKQVSVKLNTRTDAEMLAHLAAQPNVQGYIKRLVREDMYRIAEDGMMEDQLAAMMADGTAKVSRSSVGGDSCAFFDVPAGSAVERWLVRRFDARQEAITEGTWVVYCGDGQDYDRYILPILDRLLSDPLADAPRFSDMAEARAYVETALGEYAGDYDVDAIASDVTGWVDGQLALLCNDDFFWEVCARHDLKA